MEDVSFPSIPNSTQSSCGNTAIRRGHHQKVVSFSFYGEMKNDKRDYFQGFVKNLEIVQERRRFSINILMALYLGVLSWLGDQAIY